MSTEKVVYASAEEERRWNSLSTVMNSFHQWFKDELKVIYDSADGSFNVRGMSLSMYLDTVRRWKASLNAHHTTEEHFIFPVLARELPQFAPGAEHIDSHKAIHDGLDDLANNLMKWRREPSSYSPEVMKACLDNIRTVLIPHLDQEVEDIKGHKLKPHFKLEEIERIAR